MMSEAEDTATRPVIGRRTAAWVPWQDVNRPDQLRLIALAGYIGFATLLFVRPLLQLAEIALQNDLHSYIPLVPVISAYLLYVQPKPAVPYASSIGAVIRVGAVGVLALVLASLLEDALSGNDRLALLMLAYVSALIAGGFLFVGAKRVDASAFPIAFLLFMIPLPDAAVDWLELSLVAASTDAAVLLFEWTGTPLLVQGTTITLPGMVLEVARECSGIRSTVVLFITSVVASHLFLRGPWRRIALVAFVLPLAILRNGFRILVIGLLCVHIGPHMADSFIHRRGGPIFFALSLIPLFLLMWWLRRRDMRVSVPS